MTDAANTARPLAELVAADRPRLVVNFRMDDEGKESFQWGIMGTIPILSLVGQLTIAQVRLAQGQVALTDEAAALVVAWDAADRSFAQYVHPSIPTAPLVGMLDAIKSALTSARAAQQHAAQMVGRGRGLLGPDGSPMRN